MGQVQGYNNDDGDDNNYNHNSFFLVSLDLAEHCTKWDFKSESQQIKSNVCLWWEGKTREPREKSPRAD